MAVTEAEVSLEGYAEIRAEMEALRSRDDVLARAGLSAEQWAGIQRAWLDRMGDELSLGRFELANRYTRAFVDKQEAIARAGAPATPATPAPAPPEAPAPLPAIATPEPPVMAPPAFIPAPALAPVFAPAPVERAHVDVGATVLALDLSAIRAALPFAAPVDPSPPVPDAPAAPPPVRRNPASLSGTSLSLPVPQGTALPFAAQQPGLPSPPAPPSPPARTADVGAETMTLPPSIIAAAIAAAAKPLPFSAAPEDDDATATLPIVPLAPRRDVIGGTTGELPADLIARLAKPMPFSEDPGPKAAPALTLEQYAALCAELGASPQQQDAVFRRYGLSSTDDRRAVDASWQTRLKNDPSEYQRWQALYQHYKAHFSAKR
ncbi:MAG: hypothetical protein U0359_16010 [Byssovorax sp.]